MEQKLTGMGRSRRLENISFENLLLDPNNPRLPAKIQGSSQNNLLKTLYEDFDVEELAYSMAANGYFDEEPLVAVPENIPVKFKNLSNEILVKDPDFISFVQNPETQFIVVEGNRRLATIKLLLDNQLKTQLKITSLPQVNDDVRNDLQKIPVIIYPDRKEVIPYLGVRHLSGIKKWEGFARARYIANMIEEEGYSIDDVQKQIGDRKNSARATYLCYKLLETIEDEFDINTEKAQDDFSFLMLATGQGAIKDFLGIQKKIKEVDFENVIPKQKLENLKDVFSWIYGEKGIVPVIRESRDITNKLTQVLVNQDSTNYLRIHRDLDGAFDRIGSERVLLINALNKANKNLAQSLEFVSFFKDDDEIKKLISKTENIISNLKKLSN